MHELDDNALLREFATRGSEPAFAELVTRHIGKVYSVALRHTRNPHSAEEITQAVFVILARKAATLGKNVILSGWLYQTARLTSVTFIRREIRRTRREQEAYMQSSIDDSAEAAWSHIAPLLDEALSKLSQADRHAVVLRFFDGKTLHEVGAALGGSEDAAKMRVSRAVEKLRAFFARRGVTLTAAALASALAANSVHAAPAALATSVTAAALTNGVAASSSTLTLIKGALKIMAWTKLKTTLIVGAGVLLTAGLTTITVKAIVAHHDPESVWRTPYPPSNVFNRVPSQVTLLPTKFPTQHNGMGGAAGRWLGINWGANMIFGFAYDWSCGRIVFDSGKPPRGYDFIANLPQGSMAGLQRELKTKLGLVGHPETLDADVLLLKLRRPNAPGLKPPTGTGAWNDPTGRFFCDDKPLATDHPSEFCLADELEIIFQKPILNRTGLTQKFKIDLSWDENGGQEAVKQALLDQLGLELVPSREPVEMLVVEKVNP